tara:strand:- start:153 stop:464 length:312 start_codon:yes stop_codon:yes gene_type:complete
MQAVPAVFRILKNPDFKHVHQPKSHLFFKLEFFLAHHLPVVQNRAQIFDNDKAVIDLSVVQNKDGDLSVSIPFFKAVDLGERNVVMLKEAHYLFSWGRSVGAV